MICSIADRATSNYELRAIGPRTASHSLFTSAPGRRRLESYRHGQFLRALAANISGPGTRSVQLDATRAELKIDVRLYTFAGTILLAAARLYQGQTTNMRTPGGGFAPVLEVRASLESS